MLYIDVAASAEKYAGVFLFALNYKKGKNPTYEYGRSKSPKLHWQSVVQTGGRY